jgi:hypothetical protein
VAATTSNAVLSWSARNWKVVPSGIVSQLLCGWCVRHARLRWSVLGPGVAVRVGHDIEGVHGTAGAAGGQPSAVR